MPTYIVLTPVWQLAFFVESQVGSVVLQILAMLLKQSAKGLFLESVWQV